MISLRMLGSARIDVGPTVVLPTSPRKFGLLLYLSVERGHRVTRAALQDLIFPDQAGPNGRHSLRELIYQLRRANVPITSDSGGIEIAQSAVTVDVELAIRADRLGADQMQAIEKGLLPGYAADEWEAFSEWLAGYRARSIFALTRKLVSELTRTRRSGDWVRTERAARACLGLDPVNEEATLALAEAMAMGGTRAQALQLLGRYAAEVGRDASDLRLPVLRLHRRISERVAESYDARANMPFVGRDQETQELAECFERAQAGESQCAILVGDSGIGKSLLAEKFIKLACLRGALSEVVVTHQHDAHRPLGVIAELIPRLLQLPGALGCSPESMAALRRLVTVDFTESSGPVGSDSEAIATSITRATADLIDAITSEAPLVLFVDDAQWADALSMQTLALMTSARRRRDLMVILATRERALVQQLARSPARCRVVTVGPLSADSTATLVEHMLHADLPGVDDHLRSWIGEASGGNPFFLQCLVDHFQSTGERFVVPARISALLDQQIASLGSDAVAVLGMAVILGKYATVGRVLAALELPFIAIQAAVRELDDRRLLVQRGTSLAPVHWLVSEAVNRCTPAVTLSLLHRRAAAILEQEIPSGLALSAWDCAEHWLLAGDNARASVLMTQYASYVFGIGRPREAAAMLLRAAGLVETKDERATLLARAIQAAADAGESDLVLRGADIARQYAVTVHYDDFELDYLLAQTSEWDAFERRKDALLEWLTPIKGVKQRLKAGLTCLILADSFFDPPFAHAAMESLADIIDTLTNRDDPAALKVAIIYHSRFGDISRSVDIAQRMLRIAATAATTQAADLQRKAAVALIGAGRLIDAVRACQEAYNNALKSGLTRLQCSLAGMLADLMIQIDRPDERMAWLARVEDSADEIEGFRSSLTYVTLLADIGSSIGDPALTRHWVDVGLRAMPPTAGPRATRWIRALDIRAQQLNGKFSDPDAIVASMTRYHLPNGEFSNISDLEISVAMDALAAHERQNDARDLFDAYLKRFRRTRGPLTVNLRRAAASVGRRDLPFHAFADESQAALLASSTTSSETLSDSLAQLCAAGTATQPAANDPDCDGKCRLGL